jgi:hypothetical protein
VRTISSILCAPNIVGEGNGDRRGCISMLEAIRRLIRGGEVVGHVGGHLASLYVPFLRISVCSKA